MGFIKHNTVGLGSSGEGKLGQNVRLATILRKFLKYNEHRLMGVGCRVWTTVAVVVVVVIVNKRTVIRALHDICL